MKILLVEDDQKISNFIGKGLKEELFNVDTAFNASDGLYLCGLYTYDIIILDWMLPDMDGLIFIEKLREDRNHTPILMLTAKGDLEDRVAGLERGADDYMTKPFAFRELIARVNALYRRKNHQIGRTLHAGSLVLDTIKREVKYGETDIELTTKEFKLLKYLLEHKGQVISNTVMLEQVWNMQDELQSNVVNVTIYHLRNKIDIGREESLIETIRGSGYRIRDG